MSTTPPVPTRVRRTVAPAHDGERLDRFLVEITRLTRSQIRRLILDDRVRVDGRSRKPGFALSVGAVVEVEIPPPRPSHVAPQDIPLDILFEDDAIVVVNKPAGLVVHPGAGNPDRTLVNALVHHCPAIEGVGGVRRPGIVHRLDKETSGVLVAAKTHAAYLALVEAMQRRAVVRTYRALVWGLVTEARRIDAPIGRDPRNRKRMAVRESGGRPSVTDCRPIRLFDFISHVELTLQTGRTHQIRVHLSYIGFPVVGDPVYGGRMRAVARLPIEQRRRARACLAELPRQALHAWGLAFAHPISGRPMRVEVGPPADLAGLLAKLERMSGRPSPGRDE